MTLDKIINKCYDYKSLKMGEIHLIQIGGSEMKKSALFIAAIMVFCVLAVASGEAASRADLKGPIYIQLPYDGGFPVYWVSGNTRFKQKADELAETVIAR